MLQAALLISLVSPLLSPPQEGAGPGESGQEQEGGVLEAFAVELQEAARPYQATMESNGELILAGELDEANRRLLAVVPESERTAAHEFLLGNWFFAVDFELAVRHHQRAFELAPKNPVVVAEWATELHRAEQYSAALEHYEEYSALLEARRAGSTPPHVEALRAECLLRLGRMEEAVVAWRAADPRENHLLMGEALIRVHADPHPLRQRADLLREIRAGDVEPLEKLIQLDLHWSEHPLDLRINEPTLERDLLLADRLLEGEPARRAELELYVDVCRALLPQILGPRFQGEVKVLSVTVLLRRMQALGLWGEGARLPHSSLVASQIFEYMAEMGAASLGEILVSAEAQLRERAFSERGDEEACIILSALYEAEGQEEQTAEILRLGWKRYHDWRSACGVLARRGEGLRLEDEELQAALAEFPLEPEVQRFGLAAARHGSWNERLTHLVALTSAELQQLVSVAELPDYFGALAVELSGR